MSAPTPPSDPAQHLEVVLEREVSFRLQAIQDARAASTRIRQLEEELEATRQELGRRNTYIDALHRGKATESAAREELINELGEYSRLLHKSEEQRFKLDSRSHRWTEAFAVLGRATKALFTGGGPKTPTFACAPIGDFTYYFYTSPHRLFRAGQTKLRGWCYSRDGRPITALRARLDDLEFAAKNGLEEPEVLKVHSGLVKDARPGFEVEIPTSPGRHLLSLEACLDHREWRSVVVTPIWVKG